MKTFKEERRVLKRKLENDILTLLKAYREATGCTPFNVDVSYEDVTLVGDLERIRIITAVHITEY